MYIQVETPQVGGREYSLKAQKITKNVFFTDLDPKHYLSRGAVGFEKDASLHIPMTDELFVFPVAAVLHFLLGLGAAEIV